MRLDIQEKNDAEIQKVAQEQDWNEKIEQKNKKKKGKGQKIVEMLRAEREKIELEKKIEKERHEQKHEKRRMVKERKEKQLEKKEKVERKCTNG